VLSVAALASSLLALTFVVVPLDDRPVTAQLPRLLGAIAGVRVAEPPASLLGRYLVPGDPDAVLRWLRDDAPPDARAYIISTDMAVYGGLVASRIPGVTRALAYTRLDDLAAFRATRSGSFDVFGTVMRLAPTGVPALGAAAAFPFSGDVWPALAEYAALPDPPRSARTARPRSACARSSARRWIRISTCARATAMSICSRCARRRRAVSTASCSDRTMPGRSDSICATWPRCARSPRAGCRRRAPRSSPAPTSSRWRCSPPRWHAKHARAAARARRLFARGRRRGRRSDRIRAGRDDDRRPDPNLRRGRGDRDAGAADIVLYVRVPGTSDADESAFAASIARTRRRRPQ
jgi:hypothetical protein